jgi:hypothetical protein
MSQLYDRTQPETSDNFNWHVRILNSEMILNDTHIQDPKGISDT